MPSLHLATYTHEVVVVVFTDSMPFLLSPNLGSPWTWLHKQRSVVWWFVQDNTQNTALICTLQVKDALMIASAITSPCSFCPFQGMTVFVNKEKGSVQYIGTTDFASGVWLGVELKKPSK